MNKDEVIQLAVKTGLIRVGDGWTEPHRWGLSEIEAFANSVYALAAEREREACGKNPVVGSMRQRIVQAQSEQGGTHD